MVPNLKMLNICILIIFGAIIHGAQSQYFDQNEFSGQYPGGSSMHCFQCNSRLDPDCANIQPNETSSYHYKPCLDTEKYHGYQPFCRKIVQKIKVRDNMEVVIRKCGWVKHPRLDCYRFKNEDHEEIICQCFEVGCNGSSSLKHLGPLSNILAGLLVYLLFGGW